MIPYHPVHDRSTENLDKIERSIVEKRVPEYSYAWEALTLKEKRALKLIAGTAGKYIFAAENLDRFGFRTASQVTAALNYFQPIANNYIMSAVLMVMIV